MSNELITIFQASQWASEFLDRQISPSNISYLIQYGKVKKYGENGSTLLSLSDLKKYYESYHGWREFDWKKQLGNDLNWKLSFDHLREKDTTKHVHRFHPYKGKFIPQLVEYFIDEHIDDYKKSIFFKKGDIILDPFSGSGTTLIQANELGIHSIGIDISRFNCMINEVKLIDYDIQLLIDDINKMQNAINSYEIDSKLNTFEYELYLKLQQSNNQYFKSPDYKYQIYQKKINESQYSSEKEKVFLKIYFDLVKKYKIPLRQIDSKTFLDKWYIQSVRQEINYAFEQLKKIKNISNKKLLAIILSRTIRSCRATTHSDLATLKEPQLTTYYCWKHKKICKPIFTIKYWFNRYAVDTIERIKQFQKLKTSAYSLVITNDSRSVDIEEMIKNKNPDLYKIYKNKKISGIFTSPPYVGQIDYHEQHAYAYDLFGFKRKDELEIGPLYKGQGIEARKSYVAGITEVLLNCKKYLANNANIFIVANDKFNLYPQIADKSGLKIINQFKRPVLNRTERDKSPYSEIIFHLITKNERN